MYEFARAEFQEKAPLVDLDELRRMVVDDILADELRERADSVWIYGSFVNEDKELDAGDARSDLDLFVRVPEWSHPIADSAIAAVASAAPDGDVPDSDDWEGIATPETAWERSADEAWEQLPASVRDTLVRSTKRVFYATEAELDDGDSRVFDVNVGNAEQFWYVARYHPVSWIWSRGDVCDGVPF